MNLSEYKRQKTLGMISLEYSEVLANSSCQPFLIKAHSIRLTQIQAMMLLCKLQIKHLNTEPLDCRWTAQEKIRARGGKHNGRPWIKLNLTRLTVGITLHEYAHVLQYMKFNRSEIKPHGKEFRLILDSLVLEYFTNQLS